MGRSLVQLAHGQGDLDLSRVKGVQEALGDGSVAPCSHQPTRRGRRRSGTAITRLNRPEGHLNEGRSPPARLHSRGACSQRRSSRPL